MRKPTSEVPGFTEPSPFKQRKKLASRKKKAKQEQSHLLSKYGSHRRDQIKQTNN